MNTYRVEVIGSIGPVVMASGLCYDDAVAEATTCTEGAEVQIVPELPGDAGTPIIKADW